MKKLYKIIIILLLTIAPTLASAQNNNGKHRFSPEEYAQQCDAYITREAGLTSSEAQKFFPLFHQMKDEQRKLHESIFNLYRKTKKQELSESEAREMLEQTNQMLKKQITIEENYQKKFLKVVSATKLIKIKIAEKKFERKTLGNMFQKGPNKQGKKH